MDKADELFNSALKPVDDYVFSLCFDRTTADNVISECVKRILKDGKYKVPDNMSFTSLCALAKEIYNEKANTLNLMPVHENRNIMYFLSFEGLENDDDSFQRVRTALSKMDSPYIDVFYFRLLGNLSYEQISALYSRKTDDWARRTYYTAKIQFFTGTEEYK